MPSRQGRPFRAAPRAGPSERNSRTGLLPSSFSRHSVLFRASSRHLRHAEGCAGPANLEYARVHKNGRQAVNRIVQSSKRVPTVDPAPNETRKTRSPERPAGCVDSTTGKQARIVSKRVAFGELQNKCFADFSATSDSQVSVNVSVAGCVDGVSRGIAAQIASAAAWAFSPT